jgi:segregation and condensation protein A
MLGVTLDWMELRDFLPPSHDPGWAEPRLRARRWHPASSPRSNWRGTGKAELAQEETFGPLRLRRIAR